MLIPKGDTDIPELTVEVAQAAFPKGNVLLKLRDELGPIYEDEQFTSLYPGLGQPAFSPGRLAMITVLQFMEDLTDREAAEAVRSQIDWKYLLGLELRDAGFDYSVLSEFRQRLIEQEAEQSLLDQILTQCQAKGLLKKGSQRTDSTRVLAAIRRMNQVELVGETMRRVLDDIAQVAPHWLKPLIQKEWEERYGRRLDIYRIRKSAMKQEALALAIGQDGYVLLAAVYGDATPVEVKTLQSVAVLRQVWVQQYYLEEGQVKWRTKEQYGQPPARRMIASPNDLDARYGCKDETTWIGYKIHLTETCDEEAPRLITQVETTLATTTDASVTEKVQEDLVERDLAPETHLVDGGYTEVDILLSSQQRGIDLVGPMRRDTSWQASLENGYDQTKFQINWEQMLATCPQGKTSIYWKDGKTSSGKPNIHFAFSLADCSICTARALCTRTEKIGRHLSVPPKETYLALRTARQRQATEEFKELYRKRAGIEGTISLAVNEMEVRLARYRGIVRTHLQHLATASAINLLRVANWLMGERPEPTRTSPFAALTAPI
jgi:transposase